MQGHTARRRVLGGVLSVLLLSSGFLIAFTPSRTEAGTLPSKGGRARMLALTNADRVQRDRETLALAKRLSRYATRHSERMAEHGYIFHSTPKQLREALEDHDWQIAGENVGVGGSLDSLQDAFMASKLHRRNVLRKAFEHAAVGIVKQDGTFWVTVIFYG